MPKTSKKLAQITGFLALFEIKITVQEYLDSSKKKYTILSSKGEILAIYGDVDSIYRWAKKQLERTN